MANEYYCPYCSNPDPIPASSDSCPACHQALSAPNVRAATTEDEEEALNNRVEKAEEETMARGCKDILDDFGIAVATSNAVICQSLGLIQAKVSDSNALYNSFYKQVRAESRLPENNEFDFRREAIDALVFPLYHNEIVFAALTLDDVGPTAYGPHGIVIKDEMISHRATVFETNTFTFVRQHDIKGGDSIPIGYRANWEERGKLAKAKLHAKIDVNTTPTDYSGILLEQGESTDTVEFIEVHIYGGFNRVAIDKVVFGSVTSSADKHIIKSLKRKLKSAGIKFREL